MRAENSLLRTISLVVIDIAIIYVGFVGALKIRLNIWTPVLNQPAWGTAFVVTLLLYSVALYLSGFYQMRAYSMHLDTFLRAAAALLIGWAASLTVLYLISPPLMPPRSVTAAHCMFSIVGILGFRALMRFVYERRYSGSLPSLAPPRIRVDDLLQRKPMDLNELALKDFLTSRSVLITGAGGSVGSELAAQIIQLNPFRLVLIDVSEYNLFQLEQSLRKLSYEGDLQFRIADVRDEAVMGTIFASYRPDIVFHAAAYKHVPLMERHPIEAFRNNTLTTVALIQLCERYETEQFVFISTDKAVAPSSVLGATKRLSEWYVRTVHPPIRCKTVRFGNVLGSQGSVTPTFAEQLAEGGPLTVTHPEMDRYFMSAQEAACLILRTLMLEEAPVYALQMGNPVRIVHLARQMIRLFNPYPGRKIDIVYSGIRPGEKLHEQLMSDIETMVATRHERVIGLRGPAPFSRTELDSYFSYLKQLCSENRPAELRKALFQDSVRISDQTGS